MRNLLSALFALILVVSLLVPVFTLADDTILADTEQSPTCDVSPNPSGEVSPAPSDEVSPTPSYESSPVPSDGTSPTPSDTSSPAPSDEVSPTPSEEVSPAPSDETSPTPSDDASPTPSEEVSPSPSASPSPYEGISDPAELYKIYDSLQTDDEINQFLNSLSEEQVKALNEYILAENAKNSVMPETQDFTDASPLIDCLGAEAL